jgi:phage baseplate assembly protein W
MSFDLLLRNGDIVIGRNQDFALVTDHDKLIQDIIKMITTPKQSNRFQPQIGSLINERLIGRVLTPQNTVSILQSSVQEALITLQTLQRQQMQIQSVSPAETLVSVDSINVSRDNKEPRQLNVVVQLVAGNGNILTESFTMRLM